MWRHDHYERIIAPFVVPVTVVIGVLVLMLVLIIR